MGVCVELLWIGMYGITMGGVSMELLWVGGVCMELLCYMFYHV